MFSDDGMIQARGKATVTLPDGVELPTLEDGRLRFPVAPDGQLSPSDNQDSQACLARTQWQSETRQFCEKNACSR